MARLFLYGCLADLLRFVVLLLGVLCLLLWLSGLWLGPEHRAVVTLATDATTEFDVIIWGPTPDLQIVVWRQNVVLGTNTELGAVTLPAWGLAVPTIVLCLLLFVVDAKDSRER